MKHSNKIISAAVVVALWSVVTQPFKADVKTSQTPVHAELTATAPVTPLEPIKPVITVVEATTVENTWSISDRLCMYKTLYGEARSESDLGQRAIATVILNRVRSPKFPNTVCGVVKHQRRKGVYQFTTWSPADPNYGKMNKAFKHPERNSEAMRAMRNALRVFDDALTGDAILPPTALNYHATYSRPVWRHNLTHEATIDRHVFYTGF